MLGARIHPGQQRHSQFVTARLNRPHQPSFEPSNPHGSSNPNSFVSGRRQKQWGQSS